MAEAAAHAAGHLVAPAAGRSAGRFLTFRVDDDLYALRAEAVSAVVRVPPAARVPQGPKSLIGLANLRGSILPLVSLAALLGREPRPAHARARALVLDGVAPVALTVDAVEDFVSIAAADLDARQANLAATPGEELQGAFRAGSGEGDIAKVLDVETLLAAAFGRRARRPMAHPVAYPGAHPATAPTLVPRTRSGQATVQKLVTFEVAGQEYALALDVVRKIMPVPAAATLVPRTEALVLGLTSFRDALLPLLSLRGMLGFAEDTGPRERAKVVVMAIGGVPVGLVVDRMRDIVEADSARIEPTPTVLAARTGGESRIKAIYRGDGGRRLISILAPEHLFRDDVMQRLGAGERADPAPEPEHAGKAIQMLVFRLGAEEFGLPIGAVDEVARVPAQITRLPKTPDFLEGVINLRGAVLPVIDQRRRFDMPASYAGDSRRLIVVRTDAHRAGLIVDRVSEVLRVGAGQVGPAPGLTDDTADLIAGVVNLPDAGRMILLLDPSSLLSRTERSLLDAFETTAEVEPPS